MPRTTTMPEPDMVRARLGPKLKAEAEAVFDKLGLAPSEAIRVFSPNVILNQGLPFEVKLPNTATRKVLSDADTGLDLLGPFEDTREMLGPSTERKAKGRAGGSTP